MNIGYAYNQEKRSETIAAAHGVAQRYSVSLVDNRAGSAIQRRLNERLTSHASRKTFQFKANTTGLPDNLKSGIENLSGHSMDDVKVHYHSSKPAQLNAHAYAQGNQIHVAPGQEKHLAHEAWHVVQQKQGRVRPTTQLKGKVNVNDDSSLEHEADVMGAKAMSAAGFVAQRASSTGHVHYHYSPVAQLRNNTEIAYQQGTLDWRGTNNGAHGFHQQAVGISTTAFLDPEDMEQGERTGAAPAGSIYTNGGGHYRAQNNGNNLTQGHLLNANLGGKAEPFNLFPVTAEMNHLHSVLVEDQVKAMVLRLHDERTAEGSLAAGPFVPAPGLATGAGRGANQALPAAELAQVNAMQPAVGLAVNAFFAGAGGTPLGVAAALAVVPADNPAFLADRIINAVALVPGATAADVAGAANAIAVPIGGAVAVAIGGAAAAAGVALNAGAAAVLLTGAIGGAASQPGLAGNLTATPTDISDAFAAHPGGGVALPAGGMFNWDTVRVYYRVQVNSPGINGNGVMQPNNLRQEIFECQAAFTQQDGITPDFNEPHIQHDVQAPRNLNDELAALINPGNPALGLPTAPQGLVIGPAIQDGGGAGGVGVQDAPSQHNIVDALGNIVGHATLFNHG